MKPFASMTQRIKTFYRDEDGSGAVEFIMMVPLLVWAWLATVVYFDAYRTEAIAIKATTTLADMVSRETDDIDSNYLNSMRKMLKFLSNADTIPDFRLTVFTWDEGNKKYKVRWSRERGSQPTLTNATINDYASKLPNINDEQNVILVETWTDYKPSFNAGLTDSTFENLMVINPRFAGQLCVVTGTGNRRC